MEICMYKCVGVSGARAWAHDFKAEAPRRTSSHTYRVNGTDKKSVVCSFPLSLTLTFI